MQHEAPAATPRVTDAELVAFLQWALPRLQLRWPGFRRVRRQVRRRLRRRLGDLSLPSLTAYHRHLEQRPAEWPVLDALCRITISRFYRDRRVFDALRDEALPAICDAAAAAKRATVRIWSAGCASGEEPYSIALVWRLALAPRYPGLTVEIVGSDADEALLRRARRARYPRGCLKDLPADWQRVAFEHREGTVALRADYRDGVSFVAQDIRQAMPAGPFELILCRNLAFTYFDEEQQRTVLGRLRARLRPRGFFVIGGHEALPDGSEDLEPWATAIFRLA